MSELGDNTSSLKGMLAVKLKHSEINYVFLSEDPPVWDVVWNCLPWKPVWYSKQMISYQHAYLEGAGRSVINSSLIICNNGKPCGIWPLTLDYTNALIISSLGTSVVPPLFIPSISPRTIKKLTTKAISFVLSMSEAQAVFFEEPSVPGNNAVGLSEWHCQLMARGAELSSKHDLYINMDLSLSNIRSALRKSYKSLITSGKRSWEIVVMDAHNLSLEMWMEFKALHKTVSGRVTRSDETWYQQYEMIEQNNAILVALRDIKGFRRMVGAGFFQFTCDEGLYAVAAYDRNLFEYPLGHIVQQRVIEEFKNIGIKWYKLGARPYPAELPTPTTKELAIAEFKQGFATHVFPKYIFELTRPDNLFKGTV